MSNRYFLQMSFKGTRFHGWQVQPNASTVQELMETALSAILREKIAVVGAGRTDTGVHASFFVLHFDSVQEDLQNQNLSYRLNRFLPEDVAVQGIRKVNQDAHARFSAISRTYKYFITTQKDPFETDTSWLCTGSLQVEQMNDASRTLLDYTDFTSFSRLHTDVKTNRCKIFTAEWEKQGSQLVFTIKADRFLRNMVRAIVGTLMEVGQGKLTVPDFRNIIEKKNRGAAGASAPAHGLFLVDIQYPGDCFSK